MNFKQYSKDTRNEDNIQENRPMRTQTELVNSKIKIKVDQTKILEKINIIKAKNSERKNTTQQINKRFEELKSKRTESYKNIEKSIESNEKLFKNNDKVTIKVIETQKNNKKIYKSIYENSKYSQENKSKLKFKIIVCITILISFLIVFSFYYKQSNKLKNNTKIKNLVTIEKNKNIKHNRKLDDETYKGGYMIIKCTDSISGTGKIFGYTTNPIISLDGNSEERSDYVNYNSSWAGKTIKIFFKNPLSTTYELFYQKNYIKEVDMTNLKT